MTFLIIGATGSVAGRATTQLLQGGTSVRLLVRNAEKAAKLFGALPKEGVELVSGAFDDPKVLDRAFSEVSTVFQALGTSPQQVVLEKRLIDAAALAGVVQVVRLSVMGAVDDPRYEILRRHAELDSYLRVSGVAHTLLRPATFSAICF